MSGRRDFLAAVVKPRWRDLLDGVAAVSGQVIARLMGLIGVALGCGRSGRAAVAACLDGYSSRGLFRLGQVAAPLLGRADEHRVGTEG